MFNFMIDYAKTRKAVEEFLFNYENMKLKLEESKLLNVSASFVMINPNKNSNPVKTLENKVIYSMEVEEKLMLLIETIEKAFNRLNTEDKNKESEVDNN